jgi:orotidine-5'-phosphate decarboxylase
LDPRWESLPPRIRARFPDTPRGRASAYEEFCFRVLDIVASQVAVVKPQSAFFEACGPTGLEALQNIMKRARHLGLMTILDAKRGDIASTATAYAEMAFHAFEADALTVNPYLGRDSIDPFLEISRKLGRGLFILVRTSNKGGREFQGLDVGGQPLYRRVGEAVEAWTREHLGEERFGDLGAVVGATCPAELAELRKLLPSTFFLVPGYGAQGGTAVDTAHAYRADGLGAVVNSSRGILFPAGADPERWEEAVERVTKTATAELAAAAQPRH